MREQCSGLELTLKERTSQPLTQEEQDLLLLIQLCSFVLPDPLLMQTCALGTVVSSTKQHIVPEFPPMPAEAIQELGGFFGPLVTPAAHTDDERHTL